ncbi:MAG: DEAD/DEAH box helicase family protein [Chloroflexota bacterium]
MSNFAFLRTEWPELHEAAAKAEELGRPDPRAACFYARRTLELAIRWVYQNDAALKLPYQDHLNALIHEPTFKEVAGQPIFVKARLLKDLGNQAVHKARPVREQDSVTAIRELFHFCFWLARTYARESRPTEGLNFDPALLPETSPIPPQTRKQLEDLERQLQEKDERLTELLSGKKALDEELEQLRAEVAEIRATNQSVPDTHDYSEEETRDYFIDLLLREAGWSLDGPDDTEFQVSGMPNSEGIGFVDYVLWGDDGRPLGLVEAKRTKRDARAGQQQAKLYADCLETRFGQRPVIFYSNGYEHWIWDDVQYPPRAIQGFLKKDELELTAQRRASRRPLATAEIDPAIVERHYQTRAIRRIGEAFEKDKERAALLVMATGSGKTRTVIALCDMLMRSNWVKRVLFLADRVALVKQAVGAFKRHLPGSSPVNLVEDKHAEGRVYVSTYQTVMRLIDETHDGQKKFGVGHFDLVVIDEAHRSVYNKYWAIFEYFDSLLVGLTATPKDEVDRNTYRLFELETGVPTDVYELEDAVNDGYLVPPRSVSVPLKFQREGIRYDDLSEEEKERWDALEWSEEGGIPDRVDPQALNQWLFNADTVDKVLEHLMTHGLRVAGGDRMGKTIIFAKNHAHAEFIAERFNANYPHYRGSFARVIDFQVEYAQSLIDDFYHADKPPHIAISVDMLDTGIDVPEVVNLVFFKLVRSKTKFWQMLGRGTRLCPDLFGPGQDKEFFYVFDFCQNLEFFSQDVPAADAHQGEPLGTRLFQSRVELISELDRALAADGTEGVREAAAVYGDPETERQLRESLTERLRQQVEAMNVDNFIVRPKRRLVEKYARPEAWATLSAEDLGELEEEVARLPSELEDVDEEAKRFDLLMLRLQLALLRAEPGFARLRDQVRSIAGSLEEQANIPMVREQMELIQEIQSDEWWQDVTTPMLERARRRLRSLVKLIEQAKRKPVYTDFEDELGDQSHVELPGFGPREDFERFRAKARQFLRQHEDHVTIHKLRHNEALTPTDLEELERMMLEEGVGTEDDLQRAAEENEGLGLFIRSLVGLDRETAKRELARFLTSGTATSSQIEFINMIVDHLTERGVMEPALLYESPYTDVSPHGPEGVFPDAQVDELFSVLKDIRQRAVA